MEQNAPFEVDIDFREGVQHRAPRDGAFGDQPSDTGTRGTPKHVRQYVVRNAFNNINFGVYQFWCRGPRAPRDGPCDVVPGPRMKLAIWSRALGTPKLVRQSVVENAVYDMDIKLGFGVLRHQWSGHQGMGLARWPLKGWMELAIWSRDLGHPRTCAPNCGAKRPL